MFWWSFRDVSGDLLILQKASYIWFSDVHRWAFKAFTWQELWSRLSGSRARRSTPEALFSPPATQTRLAGARSWTTPPGEQQVKIIGLVERLVGGIGTGSLESDMQRIKNGLVTWVASSVTRWSSRWTSPWLVSNCSRNLSLNSACDNFWKTNLWRLLGKCLWQTLEDF